MKVCIVTAGLLPVPDVRGGAIERLMTMIADVNEKEHRLEITIVTQFNKKAVDLQRAYNYTQFVNIKNWGRLYYNLAWKMRGLLKKIIKKDFYDLHIYEHRVKKYLLKNGYKYDLIINEGLQYNVLAKVAKKYGRERLCAHLHCNQLANFDFERIYGGVITVSDFIKNQYAKNSSLPQNRIRTVFNGIDLSKIQVKISIGEKMELRKKLGLKEDDFVLIFCGRLVAQKGIKETIDALSKIDGAKIKLLILGSSNFGLGDQGDFPIIIKKMIEDNKERIRFTGFVPNSEIHKYLSISDVGLVPSVYNDPCPLSMIEMIASGLPTIATRAGGMTEIGNEDTTRFIHIDSFQKDFIESICALYQDKVLLKNMRTSARSRSVFFSKERFYQDYINTVSNLMAR